MVDPDKLLHEQVEYYKARAGEYDEWFKRLGRYDHGQRLNTQWFKEVEEIKIALQKFNPKGDVFEIAAGTGWWTQELIEYADHVTAVDSSSEVLEINKEKVGTKKVTFIHEDIFTFTTKKRYDVVFFSFWLSHVSPEKFEQFWRIVRGLLKLNGRVFFIDQSNSSGKTFTIMNPKDSTSIRKLNDGRNFTVYKVFYKPKDLEKRLQSLGWTITVDNTGKYFLYGFTAS